MAFLVVIPAQAGIQNLNWIPACAGMTQTNILMTEKFLEIRDFDNHIV